MQIGPCQSAGVAKTVLIMDSINISKFHGAVSVFEGVEERTRERNDLYEALKISKTVNGDDFVRL